MGIRGIFSEHPHCSVLEAAIPSLSCRFLIVTALCACGDKWFAVVLLAGSKTPLLRQLVSKGNENVVGAAL